MWLYGLQAPLAEEVRRTAGFTLKSATIPVALYLVFTDQENAKSPWHDRRVRLAANLAIDRQAINQASYLGLGRISSSFIPQALEFYWKPPLYPHDPKRARQLLAEAGYANGFDGGELTSEAFAGSGIGEPVINDLGAVGIRLKLRLLERAAFLKQHSEKTLKHVVLAGSGAPGNAATRLEQYAVTGGLYAYGGYPEVDGLFKAQAVEVNPRVRRQILEKMQQIIHERVMFAPILEYAYFVSIGPRVEYYAVNAIPANPYTAPYEDLRSQSADRSPLTGDRSMTKRERVMAALGGKPVDRVPLAFWLHNFATENSAEGLAVETLRLAQTFDWDYLKPQSRAQCFAEMWGLTYQPSGEQAVQWTVTHRRSPTPTASDTSPPPIRARARSVSSSRPSASSAGRWAPTRPSSGRSSRR